MKIKLTNIGQLATYNSLSRTVEKTPDIEIIIEDSKIIDIGTSLPAGNKQIDAQGKLVTPGFVDPHTHPVFAHTREKEFEMRAAGKTYREIAEEGGGIKASVKALWEMDENELEKRVTHRLEKFLRLGTTTVEAKSGYGLSIESELKSLCVLKKSADLVPLDVIPTFLGAHDFPEEYEDRPDEYVSLICEKMIPAVAKQGIAKFCDVFCEHGWYSVKQSRKILKTAKSFGMNIRLHADEFEDSGAAGLAAELNAVSADHLMAVSDEGIKSLAEASVVAILLPGTTFFLGQTTYAPARRMIDKGVEVALATDFNPGSSMTQSMPLMMTLACLYLRMTVEEAFSAATYFAAKSLRLEDKIGSIEIGKQADFVIWDLTDLSQIPYWYGGNNVMNVIKNGNLIVFN